MSNINEIHNVVIMDNRNANNYFKMIDAIRPKEATTCYICVYKFEATVDIGEYKSGASEPISDNVCIFVDGVENVYINDPNSNCIVRSNLLDSYMVSYTMKNSNVTNKWYALYNTINSKDNWIKINISNLNNLIMRFKTASLGDFANTIKYTDIVEKIQFLLHLKIKFE